MEIGETHFHFGKIEIFIRVQFLGNQIIQVIMMKSQTQLLSRLKWVLFFSIKRTVHLITIEYIVCLIEHKE